MDISTATLKDWYYLMWTTRRLEQMAAQYAREKKIYGSYHALVGQEAIAAGVATALGRDGDAIATAHRGNGYFLARGSDLKKMFAEIMSKATGYCSGRGGKLHLVATERGTIISNGIIGAPILLATGMALQFKQCSSENVAMAFFGDGAAHQGAFHECLNMAAIWKLPVVYVVENNQYAMSIPFQDSTSVAHLADRGQAYGIPGILVDGNDPLALHEVAVEAVNRARAGNGPSLIECWTYRLHGHSEGDPQLYRTQEEVEEWQKKDPIPRLHQVLLELGVATEELDAIAYRAHCEVQEASDFAVNSPYADPSTLWKHYFAEED